MILYEFVNNEKILRKIKKSDIRNVKLSELTFSEVSELSKIMNIPHEKLIKDIWLHI